jgi:hypothetical protein
MAMPGRVGSLMAFIEGNSFDPGRFMLFSFCPKYKDLKAVSH